MFLLYFIFYFFWGGIVAVLLFLLFFSSAGTAGIIFICLRFFLATQWPGCGMKTAARPWTYNYHAGIALSMAARTQAALATTESREVGRRANQSLLVMSA